MVALFRNNRFSTFFVLVAYSLLLHLPALLNGGTVTAGAPDAGGGVLYEKWVQPFLGIPGVSLGICLFLMLLLALNTNRLADRFRLLNERTWLPGMMVVLVASGLPEFSQTSPALVASMVIPTVLRRLFSTYNEPQATALLFDASFWISVAGLFYPPAMLLLPAAYMGLLIIRSFNGREQLVFLTGALTPVFLGWLAYFWYDQGMYFMQKQFLEPFGWISWQALEVQWVALGFLLLLPLLAVVLSGSFFYKKLIQTQKNISALYWFLLMGGVSALLHARIQPNDFLLIVPVMGIFAAFFIQLIRRPLIAEVVHAVWIGIVFLIHIVLQ